MSESIIISDSGPLIALGCIDCIPLLVKTLGTLIVPHQVIEECLVDVFRPGAQKIQQSIQNNQIQVRHVTAPIDLHLLELLDEGEAAAITLAVELASPLLIDEKLGRAAAQKLNIKVIGTVGVLLLAKQKHYLKKVAPLIQELKSVGYYLSDELIVKALSLASK